jgi:hypothetical protein
MDDGAVVDGVALSVVEAVGEPGDVVLMHPWAFHTAVPNAGTWPRFVLGESLVRMPGGTA